MIGTIRGRANRRPPGWSRKEKYTEKGKSERPGASRRELSRLAQAEMAHSKSETLF